MATNNEDDDDLDRWLDVLPAATRAALLDAGEGEGEDEDESPQIVHTPPAPDEVPEPEPEPEPEPDESPQIVHTPARPGRGARARARARTRAGRESADRAYPARPGRGARARAGRESASSSTPDRCHRPRPLTRPTRSDRPDPPNRTRAGWADAPRLGGRLRGRRRQHKSCWRCGPIGLERCRRLTDEKDRPTTARFGVRDRTVWGTGPHGLGYGTARFGVRDRTVWGTGPHGLGYGSARFGVRDRTVWGTDFGWSIDITRLHL